MMKKKLRIENDPIFMTKDYSGIHDFEYTPITELSDMPSTFRKFNNDYTSEIENKSKRTQRHSESDHPSEKNQRVKKSYPPAYYERSYLVSNDQVEEKRSRSKS